MNSNLALNDAQPEPTPSWILLLIGLLLAGLLHVGLFLMKFNWMPAAAPSRVELQTIDPAKIAAIKKKWAAENSHAQQLLLDKNKDAPKDRESPKDARYFSDRNIRVKKEQRAKDYTLLPKPGANSVGSADAGNSAEKPAAPKQQTQPKQRIPKLGDLGVPLHLDQPKPDASRATTQAAGRRGSTQIGGEQYVKDPSLPEGSENLLNAQESVYYSFYARLYEAIAPIWQSRVREVPYRRRVKEGEYSTVVDAVFDRAGRLVAVRRLQASGVEDFDRAVDDAWNKIGRFPNPPADLLDKNGEVHTGWTFTVQVGAGFNLDYLPPERNY